DVVGAVLHDDDGVVHHDADGQDQGEQGHEVHGEVEGGHGDEGADDSDRNGGGGNQRPSKVLQEHQDHDEHQDAGDGESPVHAGDGLPDKEGGVVPDGGFSALGKIVAHLRHGLVHKVGAGNDIGSRQGKHQDLGRFVTGESRIGAEALLAQVHPGDIAQPNDLRGRAGGGLDDDVFELARIG